MPLPFRSRQGVGVVEMFGMIGRGVRVPEYSHILEDVRKDRRIRALLLDIDSPGGTASGSELLYRSVERVAREKPVVAYIRGTGASGAYYIACAAHKIVALPSTLVGSIGVIYLRPALQQLLQKLGVSFSVYTGGRLKGMGGFWREPNDEEEGVLRGLVHEIYESFVETVARGRKLDVDKAREYATGEVFTGRGAMERGLVDELGDFDDSLDMAAEMGKARRRPIWVRPKRPWTERILGRFGSTAVAEGLLSEALWALSGGLYYLAPGLSGAGLDSSNN